MLGRDWRAIPINITKNEQFDAGFLKISPNNKIPAMIDPIGPDGRPISLFESGAILIYLASKFNRLLPRSDSARFEVLQWLMFQVAGVGPVLGQAHHFSNFAPQKIEYAVKRFTTEAHRLFSVMERQVSKHPFTAGSEYSVADVAVFPWIRSWANQGIDWREYPKLRQWYERVGARTEVKIGLQILAQ